MILGLNVENTTSGFRIIQAHYVEKVLKKFSYLDVELVQTPYDAFMTMKKNIPDSVKQVEYPKIIGSLMFLMHYSLPNIAYAISRLSRYTHNPGHDHLNALIRLLKYPKGSISLGLCYIGHPSFLEGYCNANWNLESDDIHSTSDFVFTLVEAAVSWKSFKKTCIAKFTIESVFIVLKVAGWEVEWLRNLMDDVPLWEKLVPSILLHYDSQAAIHITI